MSSNDSISFFDELKPFLENVITKPESFITTDQSLSLEALKITKKLYDLGKNEEQKEPLQWEDITHYNAVEELKIEKLNNEQIWDELCMQNEPFLEYVKEQLDDLDELIGGSEQHEDDEENNRGSDSNLSEAAEIDDNVSEVSSEEIEPLDEEGEKDDDKHMDDELTEGDNDTEEEITNFHPELDDEFFNLAEFNKTTENERSFERIPPKCGFLKFSLLCKKPEILNRIDPDELAEEDEIDGAIMYKQFFDPPPKKKNRKSNRKDNILHDESIGTKVNFDSEKNREGERLTHIVQDLFAQDESDDEDGENKKSAFEKKQEKIKKQIERLEMENVAEKDWTLIGEASSKDRPLNSLLEEDLEFDHIAKPVPVITEEVTEKLEDMIKRRILDETFDDVERKRDPNFRPFLPSKLVEVSTEKSNKSLAEIYEEDYFKQTSKDLPNEKDDALSKEHQEIEKGFKELCYKLDALSNFHYTPKPPKPEITVITDVPAIAMEDVIPVSVSDATLLAPEEVYDKKKREVKGETEMDSSEKKRVRAEKKRIKKKEKALKEREKKVIERYMHPLIIRYTSALFLTVLPFVRMNPGMGNKYAKKKILDTLIGQKNVTIIDKDGTQKSTVKKGREIDIRSTNLKL
ncbi:9500_t:CDS:10 [Acaulospora morrowiae]|uniref:U3 small nucleolar ribonucleoprotein protein MPP10 n=1 Tax=Acaulospora morrowiae TaxID=94023 RepID=A0A9N9F8V9_9GLOM|nr:9500_t:CDS:10 [Acaulospora morrowiae]